jgi:monomeric sarcosine oxidase
MTGPHYDAIILGGGTMGSAAAWDLAKRGLRTVVFEQFGHVHDQGSHGGKTRIIRHAYAEGEAYVPLVQRADELWRHLEAFSGQRLLVRTGGLELAAPGYRHAQAARLSAQFHGLPHEWLSPAEARRRWPAFQIPEDWEVLFSPQAGYLLTEPSLRAMASAARSLGAEIRDHAAVTGWGATDSGVWVTVNDQTVSGDLLIVTAGAWAASLLAELGLTLTPLRKVLWWLGVDRADRFAPDRFPVFITDSPHGEIYGFPVDDHAGLKIANHAGGEPTTPTAVDRTIRMGEEADVVGLAAELLPGVSDRVLESAVCLYTMTPDGHFIVDRHPRWPRVVIGAGFSGHGFKFATAIGETLGSLAVDPTSKPIPHFAIDRFNPTIMPGMASASSNDRGRRPAH